MNRLHEVEVHCPYCGERIDLLVDDSVMEQRYTEDCQVCCRPIVVAVDFAGDGGCSVQVFREDEAI